MTSVDQWRFGVGQSSREEQVEIDGAKLAGLAEVYAELQAEARRRDAERPARKTRVRRAPGKRTAGGRSDPPPTPLLTGNPDAYGNALLADYARGRLEPAPVALPDGLPGACRIVAEFVALVVGLRLSCGDDRPAPFARSWVAARTGLSPATAGRALDGLVHRGVLTREGHLPARAPGLRGTALYAVPAVTAVSRPPDRRPAPRVRGGPLGGSDGVPVTGLETRSVAVEGQRVGAVGATAEPSVEAVDEPGVRHAVVGPLALGGMPAAGDGARSGREQITVGGHGQGRYGRRPTAESLLERGLQTAESAEHGAVWLACQLRDHGYGEQEALEQMLRYAAHRAGSYTIARALRTQRSVYRRPPRPPWGTPTRRANVGTPPRRRGGAGR